MKTVTTREVQHHLAKVMQVVEGGEGVIITRRGEKVAKLIPIEREDTRSVSIPDFKGWRKSVGIPSSGGRNLVLEIREED